MNSSRDAVPEGHRFAFGENWASYARLVTQRQIDDAAAALRRLLGDELHGKRFLDIGCGSGLHALAALRLGAVEVVAIDVDRKSVETARKMLETHAAGKAWRVLEKSVFDLDASDIGRFDVVYSWGVLHHTGDMHRALRIGATLVAPGGLFVFALYRRTSLCWFWKVEKRWYSGAGPFGQTVARSIFVGLFRAVFPVLKRRSFRQYVKEYSDRRGMDFYHDVHDWLGGWPYESISAADVQRFMGGIGMGEVRTIARSRDRTGLFGSGCDEYVYAAITS
ncbi:MAG TPA: methyltransferase domain-containing protein [Steroidobacteraceae bacterium]|nr:methyltransferase domain-containing protein [Steroidobacteraceae bacterium]